MGHAAAAKRTTGRHRARHSLGSGVLAFRGDRAFPVLIQHIRRKIAESPSCREIFLCRLMNSAETRLSMGFFPYDTHGFLGLLLAKRAPGLGSLEPAGVPRPVHHLDMPAPRHRPVQRREVQI